ncbi:hypothetical protein QTO34_008841 [Cnephaeus nilssonii]|uniref:SUI1 domain-containing protein n=1 Tax=Cnephaeus nilssonii TaxID=3371016 RepID=A0AA40LGD5_CNENI|nr:hypothetical protein QTO34_008841 [Eptesicus nilssonii]
MSTLPSQVRCAVSTEEKESYRMSAIQNLHSFGERRGGPAGKDPGGAAGLSRPRDGPGKPPSARAFVDGCEGDVSGLVGSGDRAWALGGSAPERDRKTRTRDPFADASKGDDLLPAGTEDYIHIRIQQRNGRKTLTTVQGIADDYDKKKLVKAFKKKFACNGTVIEHPEYGEVIQLQGDQRKNICQFLVEIGLAKDDQLKVHGF